MAISVAVLVGDVIAEKFIKKINWFLMNCGLELLTMPKTILGR